MFSFFTDGSQNVCIAQGLFMATETSSPQPSQVCDLWTHTSYISFSILKEHAFEHLFWNAYSRLDMHFFSTCGHGQWWYVFLKNFFWQCMLERRHCAKPAQADQKALSPLTSHACPAPRSNDWEPRPTSICTSGRVQVCDALLGNLSACTYLSTSGRIRLSCFLFKFWKNTRSNTFFWNA